MPYVDNVPHAGSGELLVTSMFEEPTGTIARTVPRALVTNAALAMNGTTQAIGKSIALAGGMIVRTIMLLTGTTPANGPTHLWYALTDVQLNVLGVTADQGAGAIGASTFFNLALTAPFQVVNSGLYYIVVSASATVTMPTLAGAVNTAAGNAAKVPVACGTIAAQAAPPAIGAQLNSGTITGNDAFNFAAWLS